MIRRGLRRLRRNNGSSGGESNGSVDTSGRNPPPMTGTRTSDDGSGARLETSGLVSGMAGGSATVATVPNSDGSSEPPFSHSMNSLMSVSAGAVQRYCDRLHGGDVSLSSVKLRSQELGNLFRVVDEEPGGGGSEEDSTSNTHATKKVWLSKLTSAFQRTMCPHVVNVDFSRNHMLPEDLAVLLDATQSSPALRGSLRKLDLSSNIIGRFSATSNVAVVALSNLLSSEHCKLTSLSIYDTALTAADVEMLCEAILQPPKPEASNEPTTLQVLNIGSNGFGAEGVAHVTEVLRRHSGLSWLRLADVAMTEEAAIELKRVLEKHNTTVKHLDLWNNPAVSLTTVDQISFLVDANSKGMRHVVVEAATNSTTIQQTPSDKAEGTQPSEEEEIARGRQILKEAMEDSTAEPTAIPVAFLEACTSNFADSHRLGGGAFGEVFAAKDAQLRKRFVVKRIRMDIVEDGDSSRLEDVLRGFRRELAALQHFQHPNIATLYAFHLNSQRRGKHYLVFELASNGSLDTFLKNESGRVRLTWDARIHTALDVATALYYLHKGAPGRFECFHRDVKAANICLKRDFTALLIDCGLAKFVPRDDADAGPTLVASSSGGGVFGTLGYICPMYASGRLDDFEAGCDIFSFGIVLMELLTGKLQNSVDDAEGGSGKRAKNKKLNLYNMYGNVGRTSQIRDLRDDIDELANNAVEAALDEMVELAKDCTKEWPADRPSTMGVVQRLRKIARVQAARTNDEAEEDDEEGGPRRPRGTCTVCLVDDLRGMHCHNGSIASSHFVCVDCLKRHIEHYLGKDHIGCPTGCRATPFTDDEIGSLSIDLFRRHVLARDRNHSMERLLQMQQDMMHMQQRVQTQLDDVSRQLNTSLLTLAKLAGGDTTPCPKLVALFPADAKDADEFAKQPKRFFGRKWESKKRFKMYFLCEHSFEPIVPAIDVETTSSWVRDVGPLLKVGYFTLMAAALAGKMYTGVWILPHVDMGGSKGGAADRLELWDSCINGLCRDDDLILLEQMRADRGISKGKDWTAETQDRMQELVGAAYRLVAEKACEAQHSGWRESVVPVLNRDGTILWVKREFEADYYSSVEKTAVATAEAVAVVEEKDRYTPVKGRMDTAGKTTSDPKTNWDGRTQATEMESRTQATEMESRTQATEMESRTQATEMERRTQATEVERGSVVTEVYGSTQATEVGSRTQVSEMDSRTQVMEMDSRTQPSEVDSRTPATERDSRTQATETDSQTQATETKAP